ncbi:MAG: hypothetical protein HKO53_15795 [Gemmatimonadetes bacterium]|nr:hypothetical protein [Gemmatimonadota bacterium]NNM34542.1 hypothetical protein [Gemmatimonadota bacterium]
MIKRTFVLDEQSSAYLDRTADRLGVPKSHVVREALRVYGEHIGRLTEAERDEALAAFDAAASRVTDRPQAEIDAELKELAQARRGGGRRSG